MDAMQRVIVKQYIVIYVTLSVFKNKRHIRGKG